MTIRQKIASFIFRVKHSNIKTHIVYLLIIGNIIIWAVSYMLTNQWYNDYIKIVENEIVVKVNAKEEVKEPTIAEELKKHKTSQEQITKIAEKHNFKWTNYLLRLADCESKFKKDAYNPTNNSHDRGIFQISRKWHPEVSDECAYDIQCATEWTIKMINNGHQNQWSCNDLI